MAVPVVTVPYAHGQAWNMRDARERSPRRHEVVAWGGRWGTRPWVPVRHRPVNCLDYGVQGWAVDRDNDGTGCSECVPPVVPRSHDMRSTLSGDARIPGITNNFAQCTAERCAQRSHLHRPHRTTPCTHPAAAHHMPVLLLQHLTQLP